MSRTALFALLAALACRSSGASRAPAEGELEVSWRDSSHAVALRAPANAHWCARDSLLELLAVSHDTGLGLLLLARDSLRPDSFPVFQGGVFAPWRPQASAALRALSASDIKGYTSTWGVVKLSTIAAKRVSGSFDLHVKLTPGKDTLHLTGSFTRVLVAPATLPCGRANLPKTP